MRITQRFPPLLLAVLLLAGLVRPAGAQSGPVYNPANGHWYQEFRTGGMTWQQARAAAAALSYAGYPGHLVTITSAEENQFILTQLPNTARGGNEYWIGLYQDRTAPDYSEPNGGWRWITGEPYSWNDWRGEPNNAHGDEDVVVMRSTVGWNDLSYTDLQYGYIVEYEPLPDHPSGGAPGAASTAALVLFPNPVLGGQPALGQLTFSQPVGASGEVVNLTSSNPATAAVPATVTAPAGATTADFVITTLPVAVPTSVTITAGCAFGPVTATLMVVPLTPLPPSTLAAVNLLVNGSFELPNVPPGQPNLTLRGVNDLPGWRLLRGTVDVVPGLPAGWPPAPDGGRQSLDLVGNPGAGTIEQDLPTYPGHTYRFSGWISHAWGISEGRANVFLNGQPFVQLYHSNSLYGRVTPTDLRWQRFSYPFEATGATTTLTISDVTGLSDIGGLVLDGFSVTLADSQSPPAAPPAAGAPLAPAGLTITAVSATQISLTWVDNSSSETAFAVWRKGGGSEWARVAALAPNTTTFTDTGLAANATYTYRVRAINNSGASDWSNEVTVTTLAGL